jgi:26S proteasome regulatory subunit N2
LERHSQQHLRHVHHKQYRESLYRDTKFKNKQLAAILLSKLYFNLNDYKEALNYALESGNYFNVDDNSDFTEVLVNKSIEHYIESAKNNIHTDTVKKYKEIVDNMIEKSIQKK